MVNQLLLIFLGVMVAQFLYMCILWIQYKRKEFAYYVLHYIILFYFMVGVSYSYFFPLETRVKYQAVFHLFEFYPFHVFNFYLYIKFAQKFLEAEKFHIQLNRQAIFLMRGIWTALAFILLCWLYYFDDPNRFVTIYMIVYILLKLWAVWVLYVVYQQKTWQTRVIFWATVFLSGGLVCMYCLIMLVNIGIIPRTAWIFVPCIVGVLGEIYVINIGLNRKADEQRKGLLLFQGKWIDQLERNKLLRLNQSNLRQELALQVNKEVGVTLNAMTLYADHSLIQLTPQTNGHLLPYLNRMLLDSKNMVESMSDFVWLLSASNDSLEQLCFRIQYRGSKMLQESGGVFRLIRLQGIDDMYMNMELRRIVYADFKTIMGAVHKRPKVQMELWMEPCNACLHIKWKLNFADYQTDLVTDLTKLEISAILQCEIPDTGAVRNFETSWSWENLSQPIHQ
jgi:hypothetical protein